jgi:hypothetical protein
MYILVNITNILFISMLMYFIGFANVFIALISIIILFYTFLFLTILCASNKNDNKK